MTRSRTLVLSLLLFAAAVFVGGNARAAQVSFPAPTVYVINSPSLGKVFPTEGAACAALISFLGSGSYTLNGVFCNVSGATPASYNGNYSTNPTAQCPSSSTTSGGSCICPVGDTLGSDGASCVAPNPCPAAGQAVGVLDGASGGNTSFNWVGASSAVVCYPASFGQPDGTQCTVTATATTSITVPGQPTMQVGKAVFTGQYSSACSGAGGAGTAASPLTPASSPTSSAPPPSGTAASAPCSAGMLPTTFNGVTTCVAAGAVGAGTVSTVPAASTTTTNPDGSSTGVQTSASTSCSGDTCTTTTTATTTITPASGAASSTTSSTTKTQGVAAACASGDASAAQCAAAGLSGGSGGSSSSFSGSCASGFQAQSDDAVINAMAREQYSRNCTFFGDDTDSSSVANQALSGVDGKNTDAMKSAAGAAPVSIGSFNESGYGFGSACPADPVIPIPWGGGSSLTVPFDKLCGPLGILALAVEALTLLGCFAWVVGGKK